MIYEERVKRVREYLNALKEEIEGFAVPNARSMRSLVRHANLPWPFIRTSLAATEMQTTLDLSGLNAADVQDAEEFEAAYSQLVTEFGLLQRGILYAIAVKKAKVGKAALRAYALARALNRHGKDAIVPDEEQMRQALGAPRGGRRRPAANEEEAE